MEISNAELDEFERRVTADFTFTISSDVGWEDAALHIILAYNIALQGMENDDLPNNLKYAAMHAIRWLKHDPDMVRQTNLPITNAEILRRAKETLKRGLEYTEVFRIFVLLHKNAVRLERLDKDYIEVSTDSKEFAYDVLDAELAETQISDVQSPAEVLRTLVDLLQRTWNPSKSFDFYLKHSELLRASRLVVRSITTQDYQLPNGWSYEGMQIEDLRRVWDALSLVAQIHHSLAFRVLEPRSVSMEQLLVASKDDLVSLISFVGEVARPTAQKLIELLTYNRHLKPPDIALQPFISVNDRFLAASPWMVFSAKAERNFRALIERLDNKGQNLSDNLLAPAMSNELVEIARSVGFKATSEVRITTDGGTDLDLVIWSPQERFLVTAECKWLIETADLMEVLNRGEKRAKDALDRQLPKHKMALDSSMADIMKRAFDANSLIDGHDSMLICRGFCGSSRLPTDFPLIDDRLFVSLLNSGKTLREIADWCRSGLYLPLLFRDYWVNQETLRTASGIVLKYPKSNFETRISRGRSII